MADLIWGVKPGDPWTFASVIVLSLAPEQQRAIHWMPSATNSI